VITLTATLAVVRGGYRTIITVTNSGTARAANVQLTAASLGRGPVLPCRSISELLRQVADGPSKRYNPRQARAAAVEGRRRDAREQTPEAHLLPASGRYCRSQPRTSTLNNKLLSTELRLGNSRRSRRNHQRRPGSADPVGRLPHLVIPIADQTGTVIRVL
jgi:hypothetical protein